MNREADTMADSRQDDPGLFADTPDSDEMLVNADSAYNKPKNQNGSVAECTDRKVC